MTFEPILVSAADPPSPPHAPGTLGALLSSGGGWTQGLSATHGPVTLTIERAFWQRTGTTPGVGWVSFGFVVQVRGADPEASQSLGADGRWRVHRGDNDGIARAIARLPTDAASRDSFVAELHALAEEVSRVGTDGLSEADAARRLATTALRQAREGSLLRWCEVCLPELLEGREWVIEHRDSRIAVRFRIVGAFAPEVSLEGFGHSAVRLRYERVGAEASLVVPAEGELDFVNEDVLDLGYATPWALEHGPASAEDEADLQQLAARFLEWLPLHLKHHIEARGPELGMGYLYAFDGYFPLVELMEARLRDGAPGPVPVPPPSELQAARAASALRAPSADVVERATASLERVPLVVLEAKGYLLAFGDDVERSPFADAWIRLLPPGHAQWCEVLRVDAWNPPTRCVVDGDAFAFRRFVEWLRSGVLRGGLDVRLTFWPEDEDEETDEDEDVSAMAARARKVIQVPLSEWLRFGVPYHGDRFLVDWRHQWDIVLSGTTIGECLGGIYGMTPEELARLDEHDRAAWRKFLREVVDSRFA